MTDDSLQQKLADYVEDAHVMEQNVSRILDSMIPTTDDPEITEILRHHKEETERHEQRLRKRLAERAGDQETAEVARQNRADEEAMAQKIDANWDRFLDLTLAEQGIRTYKDRPSGPGPPNAAPALRIIAAAILWKSGSEERVSVADQAQDALWRFCCACPSSCATIASTRHQ